MRKRSSLGNMFAETRLRTQTGDLKANPSLDAFGQKSDTLSIKTKSTVVRSSLSNKKNVHVESNYIATAEMVDSREVNLYRGYKKKAERLTLEVEEVPMDTIEQSLDNKKMARDPKFSKSLFCLQEIKTPKSNISLTNPQKASKGRNISGLNQDTKRGLERLTANTSISTMKRSSLLNFNSMVGKQETAQPSTKVIKTHVKHNTNLFMSPNMLTDMRASLKDQIMDSVKTLICNESAPKKESELLRKTSAINFNLNFNLAINGCGQLVSHKNSNAKKSLTGFTVSKSKLTPNEKLTRPVNTPFLKKPEKTPNKPVQAFKFSSTNGRLNDTKIVKAEEDKPYYVGNIVTALKSKLKKAGKHDSYYNELYYNHFKITYMHFLELNRYERSKRQLKIPVITPKIKVPSNVSKAYLLLDLDETLIFCSSKQSNHNAIEIRSRAYDHSVS